MRTYSLILLVSRALANLPVAQMTSIELNGITDTLTPAYEKYAEALKTAASAFTEAQDLFLSDDYSQKSGWKVVDKWGDGETVHSKDTPKGRIFTVSTVLPSPLADVVNESWHGVATLTEWNPNIKYARTIAAPTDHFDIVTYGNNDILIVSGRDFVSARIYRPVKDGSYIVVSRSVELPEVPEVKGKVRANLKLGGARFRADPADANKTLAEVVMLVDLKGLLPQIIVNQAMSSIMLSDAVENKKHFEKLNEKKRQQ